ncbi:YrrS family protein [Ureibacillus sp. FSL K6-8385]|uniref:DUF1510 family protein n=1 Tax=Ureibacillus terrenus TaxID=118246 RepID=A0A540V4Y4_9BACL|nr:YrrS family protein [Ureibacillus terrenus]MED3661490.1 YrrS family protein [Ureibacillus terrenus]MED3763957.1 YrrS family protein [Ureibacillus terrenus]TQE91820.1 DUF1510 family protein [Ureibacillus terrenus]
MPQENQEMKSRRMRRISNNKRKMNRILNILIAIVFTLIVINVYFIVNDEQQEAKDAETIQEMKAGKGKQSNKAGENDKNNEKSEKPGELGDEDASDSFENGDDIIVTTSKDANVEKVIVNNNWKVTPTKQTGEHVSAFQEGHIDYEEKLITIRNAVELPEDDIIYWSVRNDGTGKGAIAVVSSKDQSKKYRVHIKWIDNAGWIPIKVEILKQLNGTYKN